MLATVKRLLTGDPEALGRLAVPVNIALVILLAYSLAQLSWRFMLPSAAGPPPASRSTPFQAPVPATLNSQGADYTAIANWHLFGQPKTAPPAAAPLPQKAPETRLNLKLVGTFASDGGGKALALIAEGNNEEHVYKPGEFVPGGARLDSILRDRVVLYRNGNLETLSLPKESGAGSSTTPPAPAPVDEAASVDYPTPVAEPPPAVAAASEPQVIDASAIAGRLRTEVATRPEALQDLAFANPHLENGRFMGFRLQPGRDRRLFQQLGLQQGDVITQINGTPLTDAAQGFTLLQELLSANLINIQILRDGTEIPLTFVLNK